MSIDQPSGSWTHSFEEDNAGIEVYRPTATFAFPPSRKGREVLEFSSGEGPATVASLTPGPDDRPRAAPGAMMQAQGKGRYATAAGKVLEIIEATPAILKLARR